MLETPPLDAMIDVAAVRAPAKQPATLVVLAVDIITAFPAMQRVVALPVDFSEDDLWSGSRWLVLPHMKFQKLSAKHVTMENVL